LGQGLLDIIGRVGDDKVKRLITSLVPRLVVTRMDPDTISEGGLLYIIQSVLDGPCFHLPGLDFSSIKPLS